PQVPSASPADNYANWLSAVDGVPAGGVWAVGFWRRYSPQALIERCGGSACGQVSNPTSGRPDTFKGVKAVSAGDVWAVGSSSSQSMVARSNGGPWSYVACPNVGILYGVDGVRVPSGTAANDLWAVGEGGILHWDGAAWVISTTAFRNLNGVVAISSNDVWAMGSGGI